MRLLSLAKSLFRTFLHRRQIDADLDAELRSTIELLADQKMREGTPPAAARRAARIELGGVEQVKEGVRAARVGAWLETLLRDIRFGLRMLRKNPGFTAVAVLTLALGIGANVAIFSVVDAVLLNPIPYPQPDRLVSLYVTWPSYPHGAFTYPNFLDLQRQTRSLSGLAGWLFDSVTLTGTGQPEQVRGKMITANYFSLLGVRPILGRTFRPEDDHLGAAPVVILSEGLWKRRFGSDRAVIGKSITLSGKDYTVAGVVPSNVHFLRFQDSFYDDLYVPLGQWDNALLRDRRFSLGLRAIGRLRDGVSVGQARAEIQQIGKNLVAAYPNVNSGMGLGLVSLRNELVSQTRTSLLLLWGAVGLVLLIACANMANLLLAHSTGRQEEFAIRAALGASSARLMRQLVIEGVLLAMVGGVLGTALASCGTSSLLHLFPGSLPAIAHVHINARVLIFAVGLCLVTGVLFSVLPAVRFSKPQLHRELKEGHSTRGSHSGTRALFAAAQIGFALILLVAAGLLMRSLANVWDVNPGFNPKHLLALSVALSPGNLTNEQKTHAILRELGDRLSSVSGVQAVGLNLGDMPLEGDMEVPFWPDEKPKPAQFRQWPSALSYIVSPGYFKAMGIPLIRGRVFNADDEAANRPVVIIDEDLAEGIFAGQDPVGKRISFGISAPPAEIIGVVGHVKQWGIDPDANSPVQYEVYGPYLKLTGPLLSMAGSSPWVVVRSNVPPAALIDALRKQVSAIDRGAAVYNIEPMDEIIAESLAGRTFAMILLSIFAGIALLLAAIGIYGVVSCLVGQRTHEIGIRMALGAQPRDILRGVLGEGGKMAAAGIGLGIAGSYALTRLMSSMLFGVSATDPLTFIGVIAILVGVALIACWIPARRAMKVDPMVALRHE
jgi:putative ABC transport system permease protein